jgi:fatty-acyl-CoA synthase
MLERLAQRILFYPHRLIPVALRRRRSQLAFHDGTTFGQLLERSWRLAGWWARAGLAPGDRVVIDLPNAPSFVEARLGAILAGVVAVPVPPGTDDARLGWIADFVQARAYVGSRAEQLPGLASIALDPLAGHRETYEASLASSAPLARSPTIRGEDLMTLNFTSGTTGDPKGVMGTVAGWGWSLYHSLAENRVPVGRDEVFLHAISLATAGSALLLPAVLSGARSLFLPEWDPDRATALVEEKRVTRLFLTPTLLAEFVDAARSARRDVSSLRSVFYGTEAIPAARIRKALSVLGPVLQQGYGMAEVLPPVCVLHPGEHARAMRDGDHEVLESAGRPTRAVDLRVFDQKDQPLGPCVPGSIRLRGRTLSPGYWARPDWTAASRRNGYYVSGDVGFLDQRGYLHILGREGSVPSPIARRWVEWAETRPDVCVAWVTEDDPGRILHLVPARGADGRAAGEEAVAAAGGELGSFVVHSRAPRTPSGKLRPGA